MTTNTFNTVLDHSSDAGFRAWGSELGISFAAVGLVQTTDTGQINWTTVLRPAISTVGGYEIWRFSDSSLVMKIEYGTSTTATFPLILLTVGTGSNGSGTLTGQLSTRSTFTAVAAPTSTATNYTSYICHNGSAFSFVWKRGSYNAGNSPMAFGCVGKAVDSSGTPNMTAFGVLRCGSGGQSTLQSVKLSSVAATNTDSTNYIVFPGNPSNSTTGTAIQAYLCWMNAHAVMPFEWACGYLRTEQLPFTSFPVSLISTPTHTYLPLDNLGSSATLNGQSGTTYSLAFIYE